MRVRRFQLLNVFAESTFGGNPLCVIENADGLDDAQMQLIARQFNLSETTFVLPSERAAARIRIFTPTYEMPFAGHPTLGTAHVVRDLMAAGDQFALEMPAGLIPVRAEADRWTLTANPPRHRPLDASRSELAAMLGLPESAIAHPALWLDCGSEQPMIPLTDPAHVHACAPDATLLARFCRNRAGQPKAYVFAPTADGFEARYFWLAAGGLCEDPATGSACANLGGWWQATQGDRPLKARISQAKAIGRDSVLGLSVDQGCIEVSGRVIPIGRGELIVP